MQYEIWNLGWTWLRYFGNWLPGCVIRLVKRMRTWRGGAVISGLLAVLMLAACVPVSTVPVTVEPTPTEVAETVLCIGVVRDAASQQHVFFQRAGDTMEQTLTEQGMVELVSGGFTVEHNKCFESFQKAADWLTKGAVTLPEQATEQDFIKVLLEWKQQRYLSQR